MVLDKNNELHYSISNNSSENVIANPVSVYVNGTEVTLNGDKTFSEQNYNTIYEFGVYLNIPNNKPIANKKYLTEYFNIYVNGQQVYGCKYYDLYSHYGQNVYDIEDSMRDCSNEYPVENGKYDRDNPRNFVINGESTHISLHYTFAEQGYELMYNASLGENMTEVTNSKSEPGFIYSTEKITIYMNGPHQVSPYYTTKYYIGDGTLYNVSLFMQEVSDTDKPIDENIYDTECITIYMDDVEINASENYTFAEQGYTLEFLYDNNGNEIPCEAVSPEDGNYYYTLQGD